MLYANVGNIKDLAAVMQNDAGGIGLFRSEFIYLGAGSLSNRGGAVPASTRQVAETMAGRSVSSSVHWISVLTSSATTFEIGQRGQSCTGAAVRSASA
ncbi:MAG: putative PEP-binding protein [Fusicatenibacter saccharivorans]